MATKESKIDLRLLMELKHNKEYWIKIHQEKIDRYSRKLCKNWAEYQDALWNIKHASLSLAFDEKEIKDLDRRISAIKVLYGTTVYT